MNYIIGCGGVGSFLTPVMCMLVGKENVTLVDGDTLEAKNLNRQLFSESDIGRNKAEALARRYGCSHIAEWYSCNLTEHTPMDWIIAVVDNHAARKSVLQACDLSGACAIFAANEVHSSESYVYRPGWRNTPLDPREYYPEINTDRSGDPIAAAMGCTGEAQVNNRQLVTANFSAAALAGHLYTVWAQEAPKMEAEAVEWLPYKMVNNLSRNEFFRVRDKLKDKNAN